MIPACLKKLRKDDLKAMFVAPMWHSVKWWPLYMDLCVTYIVVYKEPVYLWNSGRVRHKPTWDTVIGILDGAKGHRHQARLLEVPPLNIKP